MTGLRLKVISMKRDIMDSKNTGEYLTLEAKPQQQTAEGKPALPFKINIETLLIVIGAIVLILIIGAGAVLLIRK